MAGRMHRQTRAAAAPGAAAAVGRRLALVLGLAYFAVATALLVWPIYPALGNAIEPRLLGLPWSLTYVLAVIVGNTAVLVILYAGRWIDAGEPELEDGEGEG